MENKIKKAQDNPKKVSIEESLDIISNKIKQSNLTPVMRKVYNVIFERLLNINAFLQNQDNKNKEYEYKLNEILTLITDKNIPEDSGWDIADMLKALSIEIAPEEALYQALIEEKCRSPKYSFPWNQSYGNKSLENNIEAFEDEKKKFSKEVVRQQLLALYIQRNNLGRHDRARERTRWKYLFWNSIFMFICVACIIIGILFFKDFQYAINLLIVILSGAVGALLSRVFKLRKLGRIVDLEGAWRTLIPQFISGVTLSFIVFIILSTGIVKIEPFIDFDNYLTLIIIGFISGFSEPFSLNIIERVSKLDD